MKTCTIPITCYSLYSQYWDGFKREACKRRAESKKKYTLVKKITHLKNIKPEKGILQPWHFDGFKCKTDAWSALYLNFFIHFETLRCEWWRAAKVTATHKKKTNHNAHTFFVSDTFCVSVNWIRVFVGRKQTTTEFGLNQHKHLNKWMSFNLITFAVVQCIEMSWIGVSFQFLVIILASFWLLCDQQNKKKTNLVRAFLFSVLYIRTAQNFCYLVPLLAKYEKQY